MSKVTHVGSHGTLAPLFGSMLFSVIMEYLESGEDYAALMLTSRSLHREATLWFGSVTIPLTMAASRVPRRLLHTPFPLLVDNVAALQRRIARLRREFGSRLAFQPSSVPDSSTLPPSKEHSVAVAYLLRLSRQLPANIALPIAEGELEFISTEATSGGDSYVDGSSSSSIGPEDDCGSELLIAAPHSIHFANSSGSVYDSDGVSRTFLYSQENLPFAEYDRLTDALFRNLRHLTVTRFSRTLDVLAQIWALPYKTNLHHLKEVRLVECNVEQDVVVDALRSAGCCAALHIEGSFYTSYRNAASDPSSSSWKGTSTCQSLTLTNLLDTSPIVTDTNGLNGVQSLRVHRFFVRSPSAWDERRFPTLVHVHLTAAPCDKSKHSLDLNFANWPSLRTFYLSDCNAITELGGNPQIQWLHLTACALLQRRPFRAAQCNVVLRRCSGTLSTPAFECASVANEEWQSGKEPEWNKTLC